jgi:hypothetical protein
MYKRLGQFTNNPLVLCPLSQLLLRQTMPHIPSTHSHASSRSSHRTPSPTDSIIEDSMQWAVSVNNTRQIHNIRTAEGLFELRTGQHPNTPFPHEEDIITADLHPTTSVSPLLVYPPLPPLPPTYQPRSPSYHPCSPTPEPVIPSAPVASRQLTPELMILPAPVTSQQLTPELIIPRQPSPELPKVPLIIATPQPMVGVQLLKKPSQCLAILESLTWHKSNKLANILKIIYIII